MNIEQQRATFEAWLRGRWTEGYGFPRNRDGTYTHGATQDAWVLWQAAIELDRQSRGEPVADCWSKNDGDSWGEHPADADFVDGLKVGDEYELQASVGSWTERFRVTKAPDDTSDDYEVEPVSIRTAPQPAEPVKGPSVGEIMRLVEAYVDARTPDRSRYATNEAAAQAARQIRKDIRALLARYGNAAQPVHTLGGSKEEFTRVFNMGRNSIQFRPADDELWDKTLRDRDHYHDMADKLAEAIAEHFKAEIGEHSNMNCPWEEALEVIGNAAQPGVPVIDWPAVQAAIKEYVADYEMIGEAECGRDGVYNPTETERAIIEDAIHGLLADDAFTPALRPTPPADGQPNHSEIPNSCGVDGEDDFQRGYNTGQRDAREAYDERQAQQDADKVDAQPVAWFAFADNNGPVPLELYGWDEMACKHAVLAYARAGNWKGTIEGYLLQNGWTLRPVYLAAAQPDPAMAGDEWLATLDHYVRTLIVSVRADTIAHNGNEPDMQARFEKVEHDLQKILSHCRQRVQPASGGHIDIVFSGEFPDLVFVEVENDRREGIAYGQWVERDDGYTVLRVPASGEDAKLLDWLEEQLIDTIYLDDGRIVDVGASKQPHDVRAAIAKAMQQEGQS